VRSSLRRSQFPCNSSSVEHLNRRFQPISDFVAYEHLECERELSLLVWCDKIPCLTFFLVIFVVDLELIDALTLLLFLIHSIKIQLTK
jgi:hypothetical protein